MYAANNSFYLSRFLIIIVILLLTACGQSDDSNDSPNSGNNTPPTANAGLEQTINQGLLVTLDASSSSDSDGTINSYLWTQSAGTAVVLSNNAITNPTFTAPLLTTSETLTFLVKVTDNEGATASASVNVNITVSNINIEPTANAGQNQNVDEQTIVTLVATASTDIDGTIDSYAWSQISGTQIAINNPLQSTATFTAPNVIAIETLTFELVVTDNDGAINMATVDILVHPIQDNAVPISQMETTLMLNELSFELSNQIGEKVWVLGYFGNTQVNNDGSAYLVDNMLILDIDEELPHHSFSRLDGILPPDDWHGNQILIYGEIKDFATISGETTTLPIPLITVEKFELVSLFEQNNSFDNTLLTPNISPENAQEKQPKYDLQEYAYQETPIFLSKIKSLRPPVLAQNCDRSVIISGGVNESNNYVRYQNNVVAKFNKMKELGFSDDQIEVFYNNGAAINSNGTNVVDDKASNQKIMDHFMDLAQTMPGSCTLTIFVTDHGTGMSTNEAYKGARPAFSGEELTNGVLHDENTFIFDARKKVYQKGTAFTYNGTSWVATRNEAGEIKVYKRVENKWVFKGKEKEDVNVISEKDLNEDLNGDGELTNVGFPVSFLKENLSETFTYKDNEWDTDKDGTNDIRLRWDGTRYVVERLDAGEWKEMGRDTNGDLFIDIIDGGIDWNLDGDKADQVAFHEGINLWGNEVLWDTDFAEKLKALSDKGVHIMMEMVSCYAGGFIPNVKDYVENIYTGASEDTPHYNRIGPDGNYVATDEMTFLENLNGIDTDSWNTAATAATAADDALATTQNATKNIHEHEQTTRFETGSIFDPIGEGKFKVLLDLPDDLVGEIYDFEFILGLQSPRWANVIFPDGLPDGLQIEDAPGGIRVFSDNPIPDDLNITIEIEGATPDDQIRIEFTDVEHKRLGYTMLDQGTITTAEQISFEEDLQVCVNHTDHGDSSPSIMEWLIAANELDNSAFTDIALTIEITTPDGTVVEEEIVLNDQGKMYLYLNIFVFGNYEIEVTGGRVVPTEQTLELVGQLLFPFIVTAEETNKGQCSSD